MKYSTSILLVPGHIESEAGGEPSIPTSIYAVVQVVFFVEHYVDCGHHVAVKTSHLPIEKVKKLAA